MSKKLPIRDRLARAVLEGKFEIYDQEDPQIPFNEQWTSRLLSVTLAQEQPQGVDHLKFLVKVYYPSRASNYQQIAVVNIGKNSKDIYQSLVELLKLKRAVQPKTTDEKIHHQYATGGVTIVSSAFQLPPFITVRVLI